MAAFFTTGLFKQSGKQSSIDQLNERVDELDQDLSATKADLAHTKAELAATNNKLKTALFMGEVIAEEIK